MIKSIKLANSYPTTEVGFIAKDLSSIYNFEFNTNFGIVILNSFYEELLKDNTVKNRIDSLLQNINEKIDTTQVKEISETITNAIKSCDFSEKLKENLNDAYETLPWKSNVRANDLLDNPGHKVNLIGSTNYVTAPVIILGIEKSSIEEKIKEIYAHYFSIEEISYRLNSNIDKKFSIAIIIQKEESVSATALCCVNKTQQKESSLKVFTFPGTINIKDIENPDEEVKPDQYIIDRDTLKLISSVAGKQKFKNISENGENKRVECQINDFILNDAIIGEIARLTKKAGVLLEKKVQMIFTITDGQIKAMHVSNTIDLQKDYFDKIKIKINFLSGETEETNEIDEEPEETILKEDYEEEKEEFDRVEPNVDIINTPIETETKKLNNELEQENQDDPNTENSVVEQENQEEKTKEFAVEEEKETLHETTSQRKEEKKDYTNILDSNKPLNELMETTENTSEQLNSKEELVPQKEQSFEQKTENHKENANEQPSIQEESNITNSEPISLLDEPETKEKNILWDEEPEQKKESSEKEGKEDNDDFLI